MILNLLPCVLRYFNIFSIKIHLSFIESPPRYSFSEIKPLPIIGLRSQIRAFPQPFQLFPHRLPVLFLYTSLSSQQFAHVLNRMSLSTNSGLGPVASFKEIKKMSKIQSLSLRMSQSSGKGKQAANYNYNVLNDKIKIRIRCCGRCDSN